MQPHQIKTGPILRVMTYNIHSCVGTDKRVNPERIAGIIGDSLADIVALQEVDNGIPHTHRQDQANLLAEMLHMQAFFFPLVISGNQQYGLAVLSRFKCIDVHYSRLPTLYPKLKLDLQQRGYIRLTFGTPGGPVVFFNTHLGLYRLERRIQIRALLGSEPLAGGPRTQSAAVIVCGDFNAGSLSPVYRRLSRHMTDVQKAPTNPLRTKATFPSRSPLLRLDHIFVSQHFQTLNVKVPKTHETQLASDHLPIIADLELIPFGPCYFLNEVRQDF